MALSELPESFTQAAIFIGTAIGGIIFYLKSKREAVATPPSKDMVIAGASIVSIEPVAKPLNRLADATEGILAFMRAEAAERKERDAELAREETRRVREENLRMKEENDAVRERLSRAERAGRGERNDVMKTPKG